ncbi:MAG TPA: Tex family protein [Saprospiraceae bacterium]|nr:Tex family protein [Saprospiraceae bacterium]HMQ85195.1 Tex family protein [Saprospiraceae bacterium]
MAVNWQTNLIAQVLNLPGKSVGSTLQLLEEGATVPFIARYRKEATGSLDEVQIADIQRQAKRLEEIEKRKETILNAMEEQGALTPELRRRIENSYDPTELEDIYLPFKKKRKTRATVAKEKGLEPLAELLLKQENVPLEKLTKPYLNEAVPNIAEALQGARDIIAEQISEDEATRQKMRQLFKRQALIHAKVARGKEEAGAKYRDYFEYEESLDKCPSHRLLAIRRGEEEGFLRVSIEPDEESATGLLERQYIKNNSPAALQVKEAAVDAYKRLLGPSIETEFRNSSKEKADLEAIRVFATNLRQLLLGAPLGAKRVMGIDPGFRTGCKIVCLDENGDLIGKSTIYPHPPQSDTWMAAKTVVELADQYQIEAIAIGNGTAGRETMSFCKGLTFGRKPQIFLVNEAGASVYSASDIAREEFPQEDVTVRGAISIGRRLVDPLAELVKIDPKSIGVGQYQHDVHQGMLKEQLDEVVVSCVNSVGINLNTASAHLLTYVSGLGPVLARNIVQYRTENGAFPSREALKQVARMGSKSFEQSAGFLRIRQGNNPLDNTAVHPERYPLVEKMAADLGCTITELIQRADLRKNIRLQQYVSAEVGLPTLNDILKELEKPGLDPRGEARAFEFAPLHSIDDVRPGMVLPGIVNNITNFGAFVDIGIKEGGMVHVSQMANRFIRNPAEVVQLHQEVMVKVLEVDLQRKRIQLSMKEAL